MYYDKGRSKLIVFAGYSGKMDPKGKGLLGLTDHTFNQCRKGGEITDKRKLIMIHST
jgi:hypothetical protein